MAKAQQSQPARFPSYEKLPTGAAYSGASANYGKDHLDAINATASQDPDKGLTVFSPETFTSGGLLRIARDRITRGKVEPPSPDALSKGARHPAASEEGFQIWHEVHGKGPQKVVFIMGLNNSCFGWLGQVEKFARDERYSVLVLDNRGYGNSETPSEYHSYKTSEMALDVLEVCDHLKWTEKQQLHITGVSMGGMISLEIAKIAPERLASLSLLSTTSGQSRGQKGLFDGFPPGGGLSAIVRLLGGKVLGLDSDEYRIRRLADTLFPPEWQDQPSSADPTGKRTNRQDVFDMFLWRFQFTRRQSVLGSVGQLRAALTHRVTNEQLHAIAQAVPSILILTGDWDHLVKPANSFHLAKHLATHDKTTFTVIKGAGHAVQAQYPDRLNGELETNWSRGWDNSHKAK